MDQKRLFIAIAISVAILAIFQVMMPARHPAPHPPTAPTEAAAPATSPSGTTGGGAAGPLGASEPVATPAVPETEAPRIKISAPGISGSMSLAGAKLDDVLLNDYHETVEKDSPLVQLLAPRTSKFPSYVQFGWTADGNVKVPDNATLWTASAQTLTPAKPVTLSWNNGAGLTFEITLAIDDNYMFTVTQRVVNATDAAVTVRPWSRVRRDYTPQTAGYSVLHEGFVGWVGDSLHDVTYSSAKSEAAKHDDVAFTGTSVGGWAGFTDKYWLSAVVPDQKEDVTTTYRAFPAGASAFQVDIISDKGVAVPAHGQETHVDDAFVGAKQVKLLNAYENEGISHFSYAIDWGWFWFITKPFYLVLDWLYAALGNFGIAIIVFTFCVKALFFPLANYSYRSMSKMKLLGPKLQAVREQYKDDPAKIQQQTMAIYKAEKINPASGCLPMVVQIPIFFSLYKVIFIDVEMRHAPFFGWIRDLSAVDPTNVFNLFGLIPFDPTTISPFLHLGLWPLIMGATMFFQQKLNPPPPDPTQAKLFQFMPLIFMFMLARFPAGLVIYWSTNNLLTIAQQWLIMRQTRLTRPGLART